MRSRHLIAAFLGYLSVALQAQAETTRLNFEMIFDLPFVDALELAPDGQMLFVSTEGRLLQWQLDPLKLIHHQTVDILTNQMTFGPDGRLFSVGLGLQQSSLSRTISKAVSFTPNENGMAGYHLAEANSNLGISQYSSIAFQSDGRPIVASTSSFTANPFPSHGDFVDGEAKTYAQLKFVCGGAAQLSIFEIKGEDYFLTSTAGQAVMEFGKLELAETDGSRGECFNVTRVQKGETAQPAFDSLRHAVIDIENTGFAAKGSRKAVVALNPNTNSLHVFRVEPYADSYFLSRVGALQLDITGFLPQADRAAVITELATDSRGREIYLSSKAADVVLRFEFDGIGLRSRGRLAMGAPIRGVEMSDDGSAAAIVTGSDPFGGDWRIVVIANPASLIDWLQIPASFPSIQQLQQSLNDSGLSAGFPDGILGPQTTAAISTFWEQRGGDSEAKADADLKAAVFSSFPGFLFRQTQNSGEK